MNLGTRSQNHSSMIHETCKEVSCGDTPTEVLNRTKASARLLIVDNEPLVRCLLVSQLTERGYECFQAESGREALELLRSRSFDAVLSDIRMPFMNGIELLSKIKSLNEELAVVVISGDPDLQDAVAAMKLGADDYIRKPFDFEEISRALDRSLERMKIKRQIRKYQWDLESTVAKRTEQVNCLFMNIIQSLIYTLEAKDQYTNGHSVRVTWLSHQLGMAAGCGSNDLELLQLGAILHDLGKIGIREEILMMVRPLTIIEYDHIKTHPNIGVHILEPLTELKEVLPIVLHHHERYDGRGYPSGLRGEEIPLLARIISIADAYDAMTSARPYRDALTADEAIRLLKEGAGTQFDARLVGMFVPLAQGEDFLQILSSEQWTSARRSMADNNIVAMLTNRPSADIHAV